MQNAYILVFRELCCYMSFTDYGNIINFLDDTPDATPSDVVKFVMMQPDFHEYGLSSK